MVEWVAEQALKSVASKVVIATDNVQISENVNLAGVAVVLTSKLHKSGSDRVEEAVRQLNLRDEEIVVNVQGDEPLIPPEVINQTAGLLAANEPAAAATLYEPINLASDLANPNVVKVVTDSLGRALYFSRAPIPWDRDGFSSGITEKLHSHWHRHIGIYAFRVGSLREFVTLPKSELESLESLEQLRMIEAGLQIVAAEAVAPVPGGVDTEADLARVRNILESS